ncbi:MAG: universal stress protein [Balneolaceae bacterium]
MNILVPTDFSDLSIKALTVASSYARLFDGKVHLLHSHVSFADLDETYSIGMGASSLKNVEEVENVIKDKLRELAAEHVDESARGDVLIAQGNPAYSITEFAKEMDVIVMSTHGRTGFQRFLLGSVAEKVLRTSTVPVIVVEDESDVDAFAEIVVTTDFSENSTLAFDHAKKIAQKTGGKLRLVHVLSYDQIDENQSHKSVRDSRKNTLQEFADKWFGDMKEQVEPVMFSTSKSPQEAIVKHLENRPANLLVISTVGRTGLDYLMMGSTTASVARHTKTAVMSIPPKRNE